MAAGVLLVREAGGFVTDFAGGNDMFGTGKVVAGNEIIHPEILAALKPIWVIEGIQR